MTKESDGEASLDAEDRAVVQAAGYDPDRVVAGTLHYGPRSLGQLVRRRLAVHFRYAPEGERVRTVSFELP